jgi:predicted regulator of Ras-like GTPase activity (Roadblock/LC7/MglB family)
MFGAAETALEELKKGSIEMVITETRESRLVALESSQDCILVALVQEKADLGPILGELKKAAGEARKIIENE